jgi:hypothetical protein
MKQREILVADSPEGQKRVREALQDRYQLDFVSTLAEAKRHLCLETHKGLDMIIAGVHFDDSRMFDLLEFVRSVDHFDSLPFLAIQVKPAIGDDMESIKRTTQLLGASGYLELQNLPDDKANNTLVETVEVSFDKAVKYLRLDKRAPKKSG